MTGVSVKERVQSECESGLYYITGSTQQRRTALDNIHECTSCVTQDPTDYEDYVHFKASKTFAAKTISQNSSYDYCKYRCCINHEKHCRNTQR